ncbi:hypothetical protein AVEN_89869-1 [Araneus ventricosus]|uniref:Uncharacterized protein n=1 Tax=Araneus ventricosus TaxID=182803 RepID=A0A4Y2HBV4_ARAVE|nr:hypothetical protein AVEN_89869-1 [Araneus ventricosus]
MLPVDGRQLENVKGELLKLKKKEVADCQLWHNVARDEEQKKQTNKEIADCQPCYNSYARERRLNIIEGQNHHQIQTFYAARTVLN